jgi:hypothetical protein
MAMVPHCQGDQCGWQLCLKDGQPPIRFYGRSWRLRSRNGLSFSDPKCVDKIYTVPNCLCQDWRNQRNLQAISRPARMLLRGWKSCAQTRAV